MKTVFLILHYNEIELTCKAVDSILAISEVTEGDREIVIVDNCSPNGSGKELGLQYFAGRMNAQFESLTCYESVISDEAGCKIPIHLILNTENGGFSKGNNIGYRYIKEKIKADFIVALNNDITFPQKDFTKRLADIYEKEADGFYLAGPDVYTPHIRSHISPLFAGVRGLADTDKRIEAADAGIKEFESGGSFTLYTRYIQEKYQSSPLLKIYNKLRSGSQYDGATAHDKVAYNCVLNGACLIVDKRYIEENEFLFDEKTFLYAEEDFITLRLVKQGKTIRYCPELIVDHVGQGSSGYKNVGFKEFCNKNANSYKKIREAFLIYREELTDTTKE